MLGLFSTAVGLFWMVVAWRAMRAHERLAAATATLASKRESKVNSNS
ncbi:MAG: putative membrane protein [Planctomycetota bacterium]